MSRKNQQPRDTARDSKRLTLVIDTREQRPLDFGPDVPTVRRKLDAGDYSVDGHDGPGGFSCERKSLDDLFGTLISDRPRFERELVRLTRYTFRALVIEASLRDVLAYTSPASTGISGAQRAARPASVVNSLATYAIEYGLHVFYTDLDRSCAAALVLRLAERFVRFRSGRSRRSLATADCPAGAFACGVPCGAPCVAGSAFCAEHQLAPSPAVDPLDSVLGGAA